jgi:hypothetical protein
VFATEVSVEILVLFEQRHRNPLPRQQERQHHPARTAAYHAAVSLSPVTNGFGGDKIGCVLWNGRHTRHPPSQKYRENIANQKK